VLFAVQRAPQKVAQNLDIGEDAARSLETPLGNARYDLCQGRFAGPRGAEKDYAVEAIRLDGTPQELARAENMVLADNLRQGTRAHPGRQGQPLRALPLGGVLLKQVHCTIGASQKNAPPLS